MQTLNRIQIQPQNRFRIRLKFQSTPQFRLLTELKLEIHLRINLKLTIKRGGGRGYGPLENKITMYSIFHRNGSEFTPYIHIVVLCLNPGTQPKYLIPINSPH